MTNAKTGKSGREAVCIPLKMASFQRIIEKDTWPFTTLHTLKQESDFKLIDT